MKTKEELNALKEEVEALNKKLAELNEEELKQVIGGKLPRINPDERFVMLLHGNHDDIDTRKDLYENIILGG